MGTVILVILDIGFRDSSGWDHGINIIIVIQYKVPFYLFDI